MTKSHPQLLHPPSLLDRLRDRFRGREQFLVRPTDEYPLLLVSYPQGSLQVAKDVETAYLHVLPGLSAETREPYAHVFRSLPSIVAVVLRPANLCGCLGHHHPRGTESRMTKKLGADLGRSVGEVDLACKSIRDWRPHPLSSLAAGELGERLEVLHFQAAILAVLLHEFEHLAFTETGEGEVRGRSNRFYEAAMEELVAGEYGTEFGMTSSPRRP